MKVVGTGAPVMLTLRLAPREVEGLRDELYHRRAASTEAANAAHERSDGPGAGGGTADVEDHHDVLAVIADLLAQLERTEPNSAGRIQLVGPTALLGPAIRGASADAAHQLLDALDRFNDRNRHCTTEELRNAVATAAAWSESLLAYDYVDNHAMPGTQSMGDEAASQRRYETPTNYTAQRALRAVEVVAFVPASARILADELGIHERTARRLMLALAAEGYVERHPARFGGSPQAVTRPLPRGPLRG